MRSPQSRTPSHSRSFALPSFSASSRDTARGSEKAQCAKPDHSIRGQYQSPSTTYCSECSLRSRKQHSPRSALARFNRSPDRVGTDIFIELNPGNILSRLGAESFPDLRFIPLEDTSLTYITRLAKPPLGTPASKPAP